MLGWNDDICRAILVGILICVLVLLVGALWAAGCFDPAMYGGHG